MTTTRGTLYYDAPADEAGLAGRFHAKDALEFLEYLSPQKDLWRWVTGSSTWIFRGQPDATWALRASALRSCDALERFTIARHQDGSVEGLDGALIAVLHDFEARLDLAALAVPRPPSPHGAFFGDIPRAGVFEVNDVAVMALARHHGIPTVLLDWSTRSYVAAYFAAADRLGAEPSNEGKSSENIAVWALDRAGAPFGERGRLEVRHTPLWANPNMRAQSGLFTLLRAEVNDAGRNCVDGFCAAEKLRGGVEPPRLHRVTLAAEHAPELLMRLAAEGITGSSMFPGHDGVVRAMRERVLWDPGKKVAWDDPLVQTALHSSRPRTPNGDG